MKQLLIACADDIEDLVVGILDRAGVEGFIRFSGGTGNKFTEPGAARRTMTWAATVFLVPAVPDDKLPGVLSALNGYADSCATEPCLRVVVSAVEQVL